MIDPPMLNRQKFSAIAHRDHDYCNPISAAKIERLLDLLPLDASSRVLDLGCGRAELALRIIERFGARVLAIDNSSLMLDAARERAEWTGALGRLHLDNVDIAEFQADPETFHLTVMLGAGGIPGGMAGICRHLKSWTKSGGYVLIGEGFWGKRPHPHYLTFLGGEQGQYLNHAGNVQAGVDAGLIRCTRRRRPVTSGTSTSGSTAARSSGTHASSPTMPTCRRCWSGFATGATRTCAGAAKRSAFAGLPLLSTGSNPRLTCSSGAPAHCRPSAPPHEAGCSNYHRPRREGLCRCGRGSLCAGPWEKEHACIADSARCVRRCRLGGNRGRPDHRRHVGDDRPAGRGTDRAASPQKSLYTTPMPARSR
jgi:SAM-dependent methyltransferase